MSAGDVEALRRLLDGGASVDARDGDGWTALHHAASEGHVAVTKLLLERGADPNGRDAMACAPLHHVYLAPDPARAIEVAKLLLAAGADPHAKTRQGHTPSQRGTAKSEVMKFLRSEARKKKPGAPTATVSAPKKAPPARPVNMRPHPILKGALEKATGEERPAEPPHLGGAMPVCPALAAAYLAVWMADEAIELARPADAKAARELVAMAERSLETPTRPRGRVTERS